MTPIESLYKTAAMEIAYRHVGITPNAIDKYRFANLFAYCSATLPFYD